MPQLIDSFGRKFYYLRLSITEACNFRCTYCLPHGYQPGGGREFLTVAEIRRIGSVFAELGTEKIRLTGGEPTVRKDFSEIVAAIKENRAIKKVALTTNGYRLARDVARWKEAGLDAINVSVDSLEPQQFAAITGRDKFFQVMRGIDAAFVAGFSQVKVNVVLMKNINDTALANFLAWVKPRPIQLRFIELMQTGEGGRVFQRYHISAQVIRRQLIADGWQLQPRARSDGPAQVFTHEEYQGAIGLIMPYEKDFCQSCNRLRISSRGKLHLCLFGEQGIDLRDLLQTDEQSEVLKQRIQQALQHKRATHFLHRGDSGITQNLASIGG